MKWNLYEITLPSGFKTEVVLGEWLKEGKRKEGTVKFIRELTDTETQEFLEFEKELLTEWSKTLPGVL